MRSTDDDFLKQLDFVLDMHDRLRCTCPEPSTPEGRFVNENTVVRLAAMMEAQKRVKLKPSRTPSQPPTPAEKTVRVLFLFRHLVLHNGGRLDLSGRYRTDAERRSYEWFCCQHKEAEIPEDEELRLPFDKVIRPLIEGCRSYWLERRRSQCS